MSDRTVRLHRVLRTKPEKVYRAFLDASALAKWLPPYGFTCSVHHMEARVGGTFRMSFHNFSSGNGHSFGGEYIELVPNERIRYTDKFEDPNLPGVLEVTVSLTPVLGGASPRPASLKRFLWKCAIWAGRSHWRSSQHLSNLIFRASRRGA